MIDEDLFNELAAAPDPTPIRPLREITARAQVLRRRRYLGVAATSVAVVGIAAAMIVLPNNGRQDRTVAPAASSPATAETLKNCYPGSSSAEPVSAAKISKVLFLPPSSLTGKLLNQPMLQMHSKLTCQPAASTKTWVSITGDHVDRTVHLEGPDRGDPATLGEKFPMDGPKPRIVDVNGARATLYYRTSERVGEMFWEAADGSAWNARVSGMSLEDSLAAVRNVAVDGDRIAENTSPGAGFTSLKPFGGRPYNGGGWAMTEHGSSENHMWFLYTWNFSGQILDVKAGSRSVDINGTPGWLSESSDGLRLTWEVADGIRATIGGEVSQDKAIKLARAVVLVPPSDPRWADAQ